MVWLRLDDTFPINRKVVNLSDRAFRAFVTGLCHCGRELTDGRIERGLLANLGAPLRVKAELVAAGLWEDQTDGSVLVHDYLKYNPCRADIEAEREAARERMRRHRRSGEVTPERSPEQTVEPTPERTGELRGEVHGFRVLESGSGSSDPTSSSQDLTGSARVAAKKQRKKPLVARPELWGWTEEQLKHCREHGYDPARERERFIARHDSLDSRFADWNKAGWTWLHNIPMFQRNGSGGKPPGQTEHERNVSPPSHRVFEPDSGVRNRDPQEFKLLAEQALLKVRSR